MSPSARRVLVEIPVGMEATDTSPASPSARRVLVEIKIADNSMSGQLSPSARRVLVEIVSGRSTSRCGSVTLREEGVG